MSALDTAAIDAWIARMARELLARRRADEALARTVRCWRCGAGVGRPCRTGRGAATRMHVGRWLDAGGRSARDAGGADVSWAPENNRTCPTCGTPQTRVRRRFPWFHPATGKEACPTPAPIGGSR